MASPPCLQEEYVVIVPYSPEDVYGHCKIFRVKAHAEAHVETVPARQVADRRIRKDIWPSPYAFGSDICRRRE